MSWLVRAALIFPQSVSCNARALSKRVVNLQPIFAQQWRFAGGRRNSDLDDDEVSNDQDTDRSRRRPARRQEDDWSQPRERPQRDRPSFGDERRPRNFEPRSGAPRRTGDVNKKAVMIRNFSLQEDAQDVEQFLRTTLEENFSEEEVDTIRISIPKDEGRHRGFVFLNCGDEETASKLIEIFKDKESAGRLLQSVYAFNKPTRE